MFRIEHVGPDGKWINLTDREFKSTESAKRYTKRLWVTGRIEKPVAGRIRIVSYERFIDENIVHWYYDGGADSRSGDFKWWWAHVQLAHRSYYHSPKP